MTATIDTSTAQIAEPFSLQLTIDVPKDILVTLPQNQTTLGTFNVLEVTDATDIPTPNGRQWVRRYRLESLIPGEHSIPAIDIAYADRRTAPSTSDIVRSPAMSVTISSVLEGTPDPLKFRDIKDVVDLPAVQAPNHWQFYCSVGTAACFALVGLAVWAWPNRNSLATPKERALTQLADLKHSGLLEAGYIQLYYLRLTNIVRHFIEDQYEIAAPKLTTDEFLAKAVTSSQVNDQQRGQLRAFLTLADLVKFAQFEPGCEDADRALERAEQFVRQSAKLPISDTLPAATKEND
ncbi:hypothetical protein C5Y96_05965 [Blastopirellula marina]|uniref:Protein BatD n=1 Tax=Blastopirellula marina TaxID=124 RepID=A0A2S8G4L9_9BACT|nr:hypothetical protein C5Y96_05965 [Blastopirellula marina]RCS55704.1 hypothetical protein DTL36_05975 [Bremerella cremea]